MSRRSRVLLLSCLLPVALAGCQELLARQRPVMDQPVLTDALDGYFHPMVINGASHDMSVADVHFVPHTNELNSLGAKRLADLAEVLRRVGGTVRYETFSKDRDETNARIEAVKRHLTEHGVDMTNVSVVASISGGRGMPAIEAIRAKERALATSSYAGTSEKASSKK